MKSITMRLTCLGVLLVGMLLSGSASAAKPASPVALPTMPLRFEQEIGTAAYVSAGRPGILRLSREGIEVQSQNGVARIVIVGGKEVEPAGEEPFSFRTNYFRGAEPSAWRSDVISYARVRYGQILEGIDLVFHGDTGRMEFDFEVLPGADTGTIRFLLEGFSALRLEESGEIDAVLGHEEYRLEPPVAYQVVDGLRQVVDCQFHLEGNQVTFLLGDYNPDQRLVIDPVFVLGSYFGGGQQDSLASLAIDDEDNLYVLGTTQSGSFGTASSYQNEKGGGSDLVIAKLSDGGSTLVWATYLGGTANEEAADIALDESGNIYITGRTESSDFPVESAYQETRGAGADAFVAKLNNAGSQLTYSTYLGGSGSDTGFALVLDGSEVILTGPTTSANFPVVNAFQDRRVGGSEVFISRLSSAGSTLVYSTYYGGSGSETPNDINLTPDGHVVIAGNTTSNNLPLENALQETRSGGSDAFVAEFSADGAALIFASYLGGSGAEIAYAVDSDEEGRIWLVGETSSGNFPVKDPIQDGPAGGTDMFVALIDSASAELVYATYLGGTGNDSGRELALDSSGRVVLAALTNSSNFPLAGTAFLYGGQFETVVAILDLERTSLAFSSFVGGTAEDLPGSLALASDGTAYLAGTTNSLDLPVRNQYQDSFNGAPVYRTTNGGANWQKAGQGFDVTGVDVLHVSPQNSWLYAGDGSGSMFLSKDAGVTWSRVESVSGQVNAIASDPQDAGIVYVGTSQALYRSDNAGEEWATICGNERLQCTAFTAIVVDPKNRDIVYAGTSSRGVFKSDERGELPSWTAKNSGLPDAGKAVNSLAIDPQNSSSLYLGGNGTVYRSTNGADIWSSTNLTGVGVVRSVVIASTSAVYATGFVSGAGNIVAKTVDGGVIWSAQPIPGTPSALAVLPTSSSVVFAGTFDNGMLKSTDSGENWSELNQGLASEAVNHFVLDGRSATRMFVASQDISDGFLAGLRPSSTFFFPQVADGVSGRIRFRTSFILVNTGPESDVHIELFDGQGNPMEMEISGLGTASEFELTLGAGGTFFGESPGAGNVRAGYARVTAGPGVDGTAVFTRSDLLPKLNLFEAGVPATKAAGSFVFILDSIGDNDTGIALVNAADGTPGEEDPAEIEMTLYDEDGNLIDEATVSLGRGKHIARFVHQLFPNASQQATEMSGLVTVDSPVPIVALTLRQRDNLSQEYPQEIASLTPFPVVAPLSLSRTLYFPQVANGDAALFSADRFTTSFVVVNPGPGTISVALDFFSSGGSPMQLDVGSGNPTSRLQFTLGGRNFRVIETAAPDEGTLLIGYARLSSSGPTIGGTAVFSQSSSGVTQFEAGVAATTPRRRFSLFVDSLGAWDTGLALVNPGDEDATITVKLYDLEANLLEVRQLKLEAGRHRPSFVFQFFPGNAEAPEMRGVMTVESDVPIAATTLRQKSEAGQVPTLTTFPVIPGVFE